jgi:hypothetical protein
LYACIAADLGFPDLPSAAAVLEPDPQAATPNRVRAASGAAAAQQRRRVVIGDIGVLLSSLARREFAGSDHKLAGPAVD